MISAFKLSMLRLTAGIVIGWCCCWLMIVMLGIV